MCFASALEVGNNEQNQGGEGGQPAHHWHQRGSRQRRQAEASGYMAFRRGCSSTTRCGEEEAFSAAATDELKGLAALTAARCSVSDPDHRPCQPVRGLPWTGPRVRLAGCFLEWCRRGPRPCGSEVRRASSGVPSWPVVPGPGISFFGCHKGALAEGCRSSLPALFLSVSSGPTAAYQRFDETPSRAR